MSAWRATTRSTRERHCMVLYQVMNRDLAERGLQGDFALTVVESRITQRVGNGVVVPERLTKKPSFYHFSRVYSCEKRNTLSS